MTQQTSKHWSAILTTRSDQRASGGAVDDFFDAHVSVTLQPRRLLTALRDVMAGAGSAQSRLERIVELIVGELKVDACSCFVLRPGEMLELYAASGLNQGAVHKLVMRVGDGLVGEVAASAIPLALSDARSNTHYVHRPELGEDEFQSFCGVPVLRSSQVQGVLAVQSRKRRQFTDDVIEILQMAAMIVAELIVSGGMVTREELRGGFASGEKPTHVEGLSLSRGLAIGQAVLYEPGIGFGQIVADDSRAEKRRLRQAVVSMQSSIDKMIKVNKGLGGSESKDILEAYQMFARDRGWLQRIELTIDHGLSAEAAVCRVQNETRARMMKMSDTYLRDRMQDLEDLSNRLLHHLIAQNKPAEKQQADLPASIILVARSLGPAALIDYDREKLKGVVLESGSQSNHVAIVARALGIPVVGQCEDVLSYIAAGDQVIVDGDRGVSYIRPSSYVLDLYSKSIESRVLRQHHYRSLRNKPAATLDGEEVSLNLNVGLLNEVDGLKTVGAQGIGLFRTELAFMGWSKYPLVVLQAEFYSKIIDQAEGKPVIFRTLDIGGDKPLPYFKAPQEDNPALGWRAVRIGLDRPAVLRTQFRAFIYASKGRPIKIMLPMVSDVSEYDRAKKLLDMELVRAEKRGHKLPSKVECGVMIEVPSILFQLEALLKVVDFVSVGTNDLMQYLFAADRGNEMIRKRYDTLSPAMLKVLYTVAEKCTAAKIPFGVCGDMASLPLEAMVLVALGYKNLSMPAASIGVVKSMINSLNVRQLKPYLLGLMDSREQSLREKLLEFSRDHNISLETVQ